MAIWHNSKMTSLYYGQEANEDYPCVVKINGGEILVEYESEGRIVQYIGEEKELGHFVLRSESVDGNASLHMFQGSQILEGSWVEKCYRGMWKIKLA